MPTTADAAFSYSTTPLDSSFQDLQLVELLHDEHFEKSTCTLRPYPVNGPHPPYLALSYAWGLIVRYGDIILNGKAFPVGRNLWHFLDQMRRSGRFGMYWIDAIAIDQSNVKERNHQVQMMRQIYSNADLVIAWLGEEDSSAMSNVAMTFLTKREAMQPSNANFGRFWTPRQAKAVFTLCERAYWTRIWIVQELLLGKDVVIHCGSKAVSWGHLQSFFDDATNILATWGQHLRLDPALDSAAANIIRTKSGWSMERQQPLRTLIQLCRDQQLTDIRDKVYALHGLAGDSDSMTVDYNVTARQLLDIVLDHAYMSFGSSLNVRHSRKQLLRIGRMLRESLRVVCLDQELEIVTDTAEQCMSLDDEVDKYREVHITAREAAKRTIEEALDAGTYPTHFIQQDQSLKGEQGLARTHDPFEWTEHSIDHFLLVEPPRYVQCSLCDLESYRRSWERGDDLVTDLWTCSDLFSLRSYDDGWTAWYAFLEHIRRDHHMVVFSHNDTHLDKLFRQLADSEIISVEEMQVLDRQRVLDKMPARHALAAADVESSESTSMSHLQRSLRAKEQAIAKRLVALYEAGGENNDMSELYRISKAPDWDLSTFWG